MHVFSAKIRGGQIVTDEKVELPEGSAVTVIAPGDDQPFEVSPEREKELLEAIDEADRGDVVSPEELFQRLAR